MVRVPDQTQRCAKVTDATDDKSEDRAINEDCGISFDGALERYKVMLETIQERITRQTLPVRPSGWFRSWVPSLLKEKTERLRRQFNYARGIGSDKQKTNNWRSIEHNHDFLVGLNVVTPNLESAKEIIEDMLKNICCILESR